MKVLKLLGILFLIYFIWFTIIKVIRINYDLKKRKKFIKDVNQYENTRVGALQNDRINERKKK
tara:strand:+ start:879 stop:1067 length:189 start_codon:yes stop_codon:yes gene_type:complete